MTIDEGGERLRIDRTVTLLRAGGPRRIAHRGLRLWSACVRQCPLRAELTVTARQARRLGLSPGRATRIELASGGTTAGRTPRLLKLGVRRDVRRALRRSRRVGARLEAVAGTAPNPIRSARLRTTLRR